MEEEKLNIPDPSPEPSHNDSDDPVLALEVGRISQILESLLFVSDRPLTFAQMKQVFSDVNADHVQEALNHLLRQYEPDSGRGICLEEIASGYQFRTVPENADWIKKLVKIRPVRLSQAALEVLAIVAYRQPITRAALEDVRGVDCGGVVKTLLDRQLIKTFGKAEEPGRPTLFGTTKFFLEVFGLKKLSELPTLKEFQELTPEESKQLQLMRPRTDVELAMMAKEGGFMNRESADSDDETLSTLEN